MNLDQKRRELEELGYCVLGQVFKAEIIDQVDAHVGGTLTGYIETHKDQPNRGPHRHFLPMPFPPAVTLSAIFFNNLIIDIIRPALGPNVVIDQWGCDIPVLGSAYQEPHVDYQRPLFAEQPDLRLPPYMIIVSFGLLDIGHDNGNIEIAPGTHQMPRAKAMQLVSAGTIPLVPVPLKKGDILVRHPWAIHRGTPNQTETPRPLVTLRYVRAWYQDNSREVNSVLSSIWEDLPDHQRAMLRFPVG